MFIRVRPVAVDENTINRRVPAVTGMDNPVLMPLLVVPIPNIPVKAGANVTVAPTTGEKVLSGTVELYNCAVIVTVEPTRASAAVVLKNAAIDVMVPSLGTEKAKLLKAEVLITPPTMLTPLVEFPNPIKPDVPTNPPAIVVMVTGSPEANGIIAPEPAAPVGPIGPVSPVGPTNPWGPVSPVGPTNPWGPVSPVGPTNPWGPVSPVGPTNP